MTVDEEEIFGWLKHAADDAGDIKPRALYDILGRFAKQRRQKRDLFKVAPAVTLYAMRTALPLTTVDHNIVRPYALSINTYNISTYFQLQ